MLLFWHEFKLFAEHASGISMDALHVIAGVLIQVAVAAILNSSLASWRPWLVVLSLEVINEAFDLWVERWPHLGMQLGEGVKDVLLTMLLPTLLLLLVRRRPALVSAARLPE